MNTCGNDYATRTFKFINVTHMGFVYCMYGVLCINVIGNCASTSVTMEQRRREID